MSSADQLCKPFDTLIVSLKVFLYFKLILKKSQQQTTTKHEKLPSMQSVKAYVKSSFPDMSVEV